MTPLTDTCICVSIALPTREAETNPNLVLVVTKRGGHIGFMEGFLPIGKCWMDKVLIQFANTVFEHDSL